MTERGYPEIFWHLPNITYSRRQLARQKQRDAERGKEGEHLFVASTAEVRIRNHRQRQRAERKRIYEAEKRGDHHEWRWHF